MLELQALCTFEETNLENTHFEQPTNRINNNQDDIDILDPKVGISAVRNRDNLMPKQQYCEMIRTTNQEQRELILEIIHRLHTPDSDPIQIFFTDPAGCGKTYTLKSTMETYNRYTQNHNSLRNAYVACASTGKAAVNFGGTTVHSAFRIPASASSHNILHSFRNIFGGVHCIIIDEVSMLGSDILHKVNERLQQISGDDQCFGGYNIIFCGDFRQLPPVIATPVYKGKKSSIGGPVLWQSLDYFPLVKVMRQAVSAFSTILTKIGNGERLSDGEKSMIENRFRSSKWCKSNVPDAVRLFHRNHDVDNFNTTAIRNPIECISYDTMLGYNNNAELTKLRNQLHKKVYLNVVVYHTRSG